MKRELLTVEDLLGHDYEERCRRDFEATMAAEYGDRIAAAKAESEAKIIKLLLASGMSIDEISKRTELSSQAIKDIMSVNGKSINSQCPV